MTNREKLIDLLTERDGKVDSRSLRTFLAKDPLVHCFSTPWCEQFLTAAIKLVSDYTSEHLDKSDGTPVFDVYVVWYCKTLQNNKALLSTTLYDGMYYEVTYNGDVDELYFDAYKKFENRCFS